MRERTDPVQANALFHLLLEAQSLKQFLKDNEQEMQLQSFCEYITELCEKQGEVPEHIIKRTNLERSFGHQLFKGTRNPSRDTVLQLAFGFNADVIRAQELLRYAGMSALYPRMKRDAVIIYCLHNRISIVETQTILHELALPLIGAGKTK
ncbi:MAG: hypothetical protein VB049_01785 [Candidatus Pelethousia sp.]|nr:hypothetical protein [Candidatus Pelethousia sp.]